MWKLCTVRNSPWVPKHCSIHAWNSSFYRKTLPSQSNASQVSSESCRANLHWFQFHLTIIKNTAFAATLLKLLKLHNFNKKYMLKIVLYTEASNSTKKNKEKKIRFQNIWQRKTPHEAVKAKWAKTVGWFSVFYLLHNCSIPTCPPQSHHSVSKVCSVEETLRTWEVRNDNCFSCMDLA